MNLLSKFLIGLFLVALVSAEGRQNRRQNFQVVKQRRQNPDNLGRRGNYRDAFEKKPVLSPTTTTTGTGTDTGTGTGTETVTSTGTIPTATGTIPTSPTTVIFLNKNKSNKDLVNHDQLVNRFYQEDLDDMIELYRYRRRKNRRKSGLRRHRHRQ